jgi:membrane fusion protein, hemolysin D
MHGRDPERGDHLCGGLVGDCGDQAAKLVPDRWRSKGSDYMARISLDRATIQIDGKPVDLRPGMAATVEINTGIRRVIDSSSLRYGQESPRER